MKSPISLGRFPDRRLINNAFRDISPPMKNISLNVPFFYGRGAWDVDSMSFVHRKLISLLKKMLAKKDPKDYEIWEKALVEAGDAKADWTDKKYIKPLLEYLNK